jgi:hypothetical protein
MNDSPNTHQVNPDRLAPGVWSEEFNKFNGEGDIARAYSADLITLHQAVRQPFVFRGDIWVSVCLSGGVARAYQLVPMDDFRIDEVWGQEPVEDWDARRSNELGFYHGVVVRYRMDMFVLSGPPVFFEPGRVLQPGLFAES